MQDPDEQPLAPSEPTDVAQEEPLPPVVARLVVEIRSDGTRTVARGALEDAVSGQDVAVAVEAESPTALLGKLTRSLVSLPTMIRGGASKPALPEDEDAQPRGLRRLGGRLGRRIRRRLKRRR